jgi:hypothetical protein
LGLKLGSTILFVADFSVFCSIFSSIFSIYGSIYSITESIWIGGFIVIGTDSIGSRIEEGLMTWFWTKQEKLISKIKGKENFKCILQKYWL